MQYDLLEWRHGSVTVTFDVNRNLTSPRSDAEPRRRSRGAAEQSRQSACQSPSPATTSSWPPACARQGPDDPLFISSYIDRFVKDDIQRVPGVGNDRLRRTHTNAPVKAPTGPGWTDHRRRGGQRSARANVQNGPGRTAHPARPSQICQIMSRGRTSHEPADSTTSSSAIDGRHARALKDVGRTELGRRTTRRPSANGKDAVGLGVTRSADGELLQVYATSVPRWIACRNSFLLA